MGELSIKVTVANRVYPLKIAVEEEEGVRKATKLINDKIKDYEENFAVRDKQDLLAMCALQLATEMVKSENQGGATNPDMMDNTINEIDQLLDQILDKK